MKSLDLEVNAWLARRFDVFFSQEPSARLIREVARKQRKLLLANIFSGFAEALTEGATLAVIYLAVDVLSSASVANLDLGSKLPLGLGAQLNSWLSTTPATTLFAILLLLAILLQSLQSLAKFLGIISVGYFSARCKAVITARIHSQILDFSYPCASKYQVGDLNDYASSGPEAVRRHVDQLNNLFVSILLALTYLGVLLSISAWLLLTVVLLSGATVAVQAKMLPLIKAGSDNVAKIQAKISKRITEDFQGLRLLHSTGQLDWADQRIKKSMGEYEGYMRRQTRLLAVLEPFSNLLPIIAIAIIGILSIAILGGKSSGVLPSLITFVLALQRFSQRIKGIALCSNLLADNHGQVKRLNDILTIKTHEFRRKGGIPFNYFKSEIVFDNVSMRYNSESAPALSHVSFSIRKGEMIALVGASGSGKSTIADLLVGLYRPTGGQILVDQVPLDSIDLESWQQRIGVVSQDTFLLNASIAANITFGMKSATQQMIDAACQSAQASEFISRLPQGYDTVLGERGYKLSGGQRQRISMARAIVRNPEVLILDEATSALDTESERLVQEAIAKFEHKHTLVVIAHRLSTIVNADKILVLNRGAVVECGSHAKLMSSETVYRNLWLQQSETTNSARGYHAIEV
jgi:subfamily B ATP-binding cassette protein MsbA